ncbi:helix-turn-helix transcriptional regulator [Streptomyces sp. NPDC091371]|uniref:helix-turn-helix domain-containing protein n=1 Tax=Streptomyces sp. NPDC091371 TaxID=3155303 RepID=UPI00344901AD
MLWRLIAIVNEEPLVPARHLDVVGRADLPEPRRSARPTSTVPLQLLGGHLRTLRKRAKLTGQQVAATKAVSSHTVLSRIETGKTNVAITRRLIQGLVALYGVTDPDDLRLLWERFDQAQADDAGTWWAQQDGLVTGHFADLLHMEPLAERITDYQNQFVNGLLQVPAYMNAVLGHAGLSPEERTRIDRRRRLRQERQRLLESKSSLLYTAIIDEAVLHRPVGGRPVLREQLRHLHNLAENRENIHIRIFPTSTWDQAQPLTSSLTLLQFPRENGSADMLYEENAAHGGSWLQSTRIESVKASLEQLREHALPKKGSMEFLERLIEGLVER